MTSTINTQNSTLNIVMGAMNLGQEGIEGVSVHDLNDVEAMLDIFHAHGHTEIDASRFYGVGTTEELLGRSSWKQKGFKLETKLAPHKLYNDRYWNTPYFSALAAIRAVGEKYSLTMGEIALRWISHHSVLRRDYGDSVLIGVSKIKHLEQNLLDLEKGPLPEEVVEALDDAWVAVKPHAMHYYR